MNPTHIGDNIEDDSDLAGEYVLGTLDAATRAQVEARLEHDAVLRGEVYRWQDRLHELTRQVAPVEPTPGLWRGIADRLPAADAARGGAASVKTAPTEHSPVVHPPFWANVNMLRWTSGLAIAASALLALRMVLAPAAPMAPDSPYMAVLTSPDKTASWLVDASHNNEVRLIPLTRTEVASTQALQFWTKADSANAPTSLGLVSSNEITVVPLDRMPTLEGNQLFEITLEPQNGSPTGRPTGPILSLGRTTTVPAKKT
ncbi:RNA polymerase subunit sigma-70 [Pigmentiphaga aceris]|uniref:RNA polymerase subunit sigma-70 n=1 Tax=Pigmentiphaga aceris TaxID=1940612 RepID=A0A5C0B297_9BURK|nr:anti-sigma factor [Pigmentiphaga aceris]QEI08959.1 RNA polymerase subunit sigma-70 [Pigmentiphaga aceris]